jgi:hypothetical protein
VAKLNPRDVKQIVIAALSTDPSLDYNTKRNNKRCVTLDARDIMHVATVVAMRLQGKTIGEI